MSSTAPLDLRLAIALLGPSFTRNTTMYDIGVALFILAIVSGIVQLLGQSKTLDAAKSKRAAIAIAGCILANRIARFSVLDPWARLVIAYAMAWEALWYLFPDLAVDYKACVKIVRQGQFINPLVALPLVCAASMTTYLAQYGFLNTNGSPYRGCLTAILVSYALFDPLQHFAIFTWRFLLSDSTCILTNLGLKPVDLVGVPGMSHNFQAPYAVLAAPVIDKENLANMSPAEKEKHWAEATLGPRKYKEVLEHMWLDIPEMQGRPSTRRGGSNDVGV